MKLIEQVQKARDGDLEAQAALYEAMYKRVYYLALRMTRSAEDAEDAVQEAFLSAFRALPNLADLNAFEGWLFQITANKCRNILGKAGRYTQLPEDEAASIAMHLVNAQYNSSINTTMHVVQVLQPMIDIIEGWPGLCLNKNHLYYNQLIVDLKFIAMQAFSQTPSGWGSSELEDMTKKLYPEAYACAEATAGYLSRQSGRQIPREEQAHLAICIRRACIS